MRLSDVRITTKTFGGFGLVLLLLLPIGGGAVVDEAKNAADQLQVAVSEVNVRTRSLRQEVDDFLAGVKAA